MKIRNKLDAIKFAILWSGGKSAPKFLKVKAEECRRKANAATEYGDEVTSRNLLEAADILWTAKEAEENRRGSFYFVKEGGLKKFVLPVLGLISNSVYNPFDGLSPNVSKITSFERTLEYYAHAS